MRSQFEDDFKSRCMKYSFVKKFHRNLEHPSDRYLIFVYHEKDFRNGGFGDRLGGLITAFAQSVRFNRTLLIKASNGMHRLFEPYYLDSEGNRSRQFAWQNASYWSNYKIKKKEYGKSGEHTMECVSNTEEGFSEEKTRVCAMDDGDSHFPVIRYKSNRAYLCRWENQKGLDSHLDLKRVLNLYRSSDLFEAAGCILRLVMWPTDRLWEEADRIYDALQIDGEQYGSMEVTHVESQELQVGIQGEAGAIVPAAEGMPWTMREAPKLQIGMHFRCGDKWSYRGLKLHTEGFDPYACVYDPTDTQHERSLYMNAGNPFGIGECARSIYLQHQDQLVVNRGGGRRQGLQTVTTSSQTGIMWWWWC